MSSKKFVYLLMMVAIVCGLIAGDIAHGQSVPIATFKGTVMNDDGTPAPGYAISAETVPINTGLQDFGGGRSAPDGIYTVAIGSIGGPKVEVGDTIKITAINAQGDTGSVTHTLTVDDIVNNVGVVVNLDITISSVTVSVDVAPRIFSADTAGTGTVIVTVDSDGPVTDEIVTLSLSPAVGSVTSPATNNGDGTYSATYTSGRTAGNVTLTATATQANKSGTATVVINAGPPVAIEVSAAPETVSSFGGAVITSVVTDSNGNGVGGLSPTGTTLSGGTLTNFAPTRTFGSYTANYTAPMVDAAGTETITVMVAGLSGQVSLMLTPVPPVDVSILVIEGTVFKVDGITPADGVTVTVTVGANAPDTGTTETDGSYTTTFFNPLGTVASTGDLVSIVVTDNTGVERGREDFPLTNDLLGESGTATVTKDVVTDIIVPPRSVSVLVVEGVVISDDGISPVEDVDLTVTVTAAANPPQTITTDMDGNYSVTFLNLLGSVASTGDMVSTVVVTDADGAERGRAELELTNAHLGEGGSGLASLDVMTDITLPPKSVGILIVEGVAYKDDMTTSVGPGLDVTITVGNTPQTTQTAADGSFATTTVNLLGPAATSGDPVSIVVADSSGERGREEFTLSRVQLGDADSATVIQDVITNIGATSGILAVIGTVYLKNGDTMSVPAANHLREGDLTVVVTNTTRNLMQSGPVDDDGGYDVNFLNLLGIVAETGDMLSLEVQNEAGETVGTMTHTLTTPEVKAANAEVDIYTEVPAEIRALYVVGSVVEIDGSAGGPGLAVTITLGINGDSMEAQTLTDAAGGYGYTFVQLLTPVAATGDILLVDVLRMADQFHGHVVVELRSYELVDGMLTVDPITLIPPRLELGGLSINTDYTGIQDPVIQQLLGMDLAGLAADAAGMGDPSGNPLVMLPPSLPLLISPILGAIGLLNLELPMGFDLGDENIVQESFGNAITTRPTAWVALPAEARHPGRWLNGDQLNLYVVGAPTITDVTFTLNGALSATADSIPAGGSFLYTFQLEEELIALFSGGMPTFGAVQLMVDGESPVNMVRSDTGVWSGQASLTPGSTVSYYYMVQLSKPYHDPLAGLTISSFPLIDPRNRQVKTSGLSQAIEGLLSSELRALDLGVRSVFSVPVVDHQQSLWVGRFDLATSADGEYTLDVDVNYRGGYAESINDKMFTLDQTPPTADVALNLDAPGMNAGMYMRDDGTYVATGPMPGESSLTVSAIPSPTSEAASYMYQLAALDGGGYPGAWNPAVTADLLPLDLVTLLTNPGSILPLTYGPPHQIDMLIRNSQGGALLGRYGLRVVGIDSLLNMDSARMPGVVVDLVPPDPDVAMVSAVQSDFDGNGVIEGLEMQYTAGDVVVFSDSIVTLVVDMVERTDHPLASIALEFQVPGGGWQPIGMFTGAQLATTMMGDQLSVILPVPDIPVLPDRGGHVMVRTVTTNALNVVNEQAFSAAYQRRTAPKVSGIYTSVTERHPDSGAPQGIITISAFTQVMTAPDTAEVQLEIRRSADADWMPLGIVPIADTTVTSHVEIAIIEDLVNSILSGSPTAPISPLYRKWSLAVDSATLEDTILDDSPAASDASLDDNPYVLRAIAVDTAGTGYPSADGITDSLSLDNYSPTAITTVANEVEMVVPREDGSYYVSGLLHESVPDPMLTLTSRTGAHPNGFTGGIALAVNDASGTAVEIPATGFSDSGNYTFTGVFNLSSIPNGTYTFMAVAHVADGSPEDRIVAMAITVEVGNLTPPDNFADPSVDILSVTNTRGEANSPSEIDAIYPTGFPAIDDKVTVTLIVPNVSAGDVDVLIGDDGMSASAMGALMIMAMHDDNNLVIMIDTSGLDEGMYGLVGTVTKPNGSVPFGLPSIGVDRTGPAIEIVSPVSRHQVTTLPTIQVAFTDTTGFDVTETDPMPFVISLTRLVDNVAINITESLIRMTAAADGEVLTRSGDIVYTHDDPVVGGAYRIEVAATDVFGNESIAEPVEFTVEGVQPTVSIITPIGGQVVDPTQPLIITAALTGNGEITVTEFQLNGTDTEVTVENNWLTHTVQPPLDNVFKRGAGNTVTIKIVDSEGRTAEATSNFVVALDKTPPVVATYSPQGIIRSDRPVAAATVTDESGIKMDTLTIIIAGVPGNQGSGRRSSPTSTTITFTPSISVTPGPYTARVTVEDVHGNRTEVEWQFTVELDVTPPSITATSPHGIIRSDKPIVSVSASDDRSGVDTIDIVVKGGRGRAVQGVASTRSDRTAATFTPTVSLENGTYTVDTIVTDKRGNKAAAKWQFTVELDVTPPSITTTSPHGVIRLDRPIVSVSASDDHSGVNTIEVMVADKENQLINGITEVHADKTSANFMPSAPLKDGTYTVDVNVTDMRGNQASSKWQFTVELDTIPPSVTITRPAQEHTENRRPIISATYTDDLSGVDGQSIKLWLDDDPVDPDEMSITQVMFTPSSDLEFGQHTVKLEVSDTAPTPNTAVQEWSFFVERIGIANARNYPNPFEDDTTIAFRLSRQASVTVRIYDFTGRLVAEPATNLLEEAGPVEIAWSGDTSAGDNLARGVYFCHILMESELAPQSAILKMAIISE